MTTYSKTVIVWTATDRAHVLETPSIVSAIATKKDTMIASGKMFEETSAKESDDTVAQTNKFADVSSAQEWTSFIEGIATSNNLTLVSSRIVNITHND